MCSALLGLSGCMCGTGVETRLFYCDVSSQCSTGSHCDSSLAVCVADEANGGGSGGGEVGGGGGSANSIDNLKVTVPAPSSVAVLALGGIVPLLHFARRRRKN